MPIVCAGAQMWTNQASVFGENKVQPVRSTIHNIIMLIYLIIYFISFIAGNKPTPGW